MIQIRIYSILFHKPESHIVEGSVDEKKSGWYVYSKILDNTHSKTGLNFHLLIRKDLRKILNER